MYKYLLLFCFTLSAFALAAQEIQAEVKINAQKATQTDPKVFESLEAAIQEFLNNQKWTEDIFEPEEQIKATFQLTINSAESNNYSAQLAIQAVRPVYGSNYETPILTHMDPNVDFSYEQFQPLQYSPNSFADNLTSVLSFYVYVILGLDYDSFSPNGGDAYYQIAQDILSNVPANIQTNDAGWSSLAKGKGVNRNRYWIIENLQNPRVKPFRKAFYDYHRQSLDLMSEDTETSKATMLTALEEIDKVSRSYPNAMIIQMFTNAKSQEIIEIFKLGNRQQKTKIFQIMARMDAANASKYRSIGR